MRFFGFGKPQAASRIQATEFTGKIRYGHNNYFISQETALRALKKASEETGILCKKPVRHADR